MITFLAGLVIGAAILGPTAAMIYFIADIA